MNIALKRKNKAGLKIKLSDRAMLAIATLFFCLSLVYSVYRLSFTWSYQGIEYHPLTFYAIILLLIYIGVPLMRFKKYLETPSDYILTYIYFFIYIPYLLIPFLITASNRLNDEFFLYSFALFCCFLFFQSRQKPRSFVMSVLPRIHPTMFYICLGIVYVGCFLLLVFTFGISIQGISLSDLYDIRGEYKQTAQSSDFAIGYIVPWFAYIINPFVLLTGLTKKIKQLVIVAIVFQLYIFTFSAFKSHVAILLLEILLYYFLGRRSKFQARTIFIIVAIIPIAMIVLDSVFFSQDLVETIITRRVIVVPGQLSYYYLDFFSTHPKNYLAFSILKGVVTTPYTLSPPFLIGQVYFNNPELDANAGFLPEAYGSFGYIGMIFSVIIIKWVIRTFDYLYVRNSGNKIVLIMSVAFCHVLDSSNLLTLFSTHGLFLMLVLLGFAPLQNASLARKSKLVTQ